MRHSGKVVPNSLLQNQFGKHGMESTTRKQSSMSTMVFTGGRRTGTARRTKEHHDVAVLNGLLALLVSHHQQKNSRDVAVLNSLTHLAVSLHILLRTSIALRMQSIPNT